MRRSVSPQKWRGSVKCSGSLSVTDQWLVGDCHAQLQSGFQACANHSKMGLQMTPTCLRMTVSFRNKCLKRSDRLLKMVRISSRKRDFLAIQGFSQYCLRLLLINCLYTIMAEVQHFDLLFAGAGTATVQLLTFSKLAKKWFDYERRPFYMLLFLLRIDRQLVTNQSSLSCNQSPIIHQLFADRSQQIASLYPYERLTVADRSSINHWQVAKPIAD